jgi:pyruvate-ferredoxin/flavodoxin oxidoreductase
MLKSLAGVRETVDAAAIAERVRAEFAQALAARLMELGGGGNILTDQMQSLVMSPSAAVPLPPATKDGAAVAGGDGYVAPWIDSSACTACGECIEINPKMFSYDEKQHAYIKDAKGGPYKDLVRAAEKCTAQVIHPGTPADSKEKDVDKLIKRAEKYN